MKQFCPKCCKWRNVDDRFCPRCKSGMYFEEECEYYMEKGIDLKIINRDRIDNMRSIGHKIVIVSIIVTIIGFILVSAVGEIGFALVIIGIPSFIIGNIPVIKADMLANGFKPIQHLDERSTPVPVKICCPYCKSENVTKLDTLDRAGSTIMFGLASGKIGKQWHCNNCKSNF